MNQLESIGSFTGTMSSNAEVLIFVIFSLIAVQAVLSRPNDYKAISSSTYIESELMKKADEYIRDIEEEVLEQEVKVNKDLSKLIIQRGGQLNPCVEEARNTIQTHMKDENGITIACIEGVKESWKGVELSLESRSQYKDRLKQCKNASKYKIKNLRTEFTLKASQCFLN